MRRNLLTWLACLAMLLAALLALPFQPAGAQPARWSLEVLFIYDVGYLHGLGPLWMIEVGNIGPGSEDWLRSSARFVPGEAANLTFQLVNTDCSGRSREPRVERFEGKWDWEVLPMLLRADAMNRTGFIRNYKVYAHNAEVHGDKIFADWELVVYGYCTGEPIYVESAAVWFAWPGIGRARSATALIEKTLEALDPISYILRGDVNSSLTIFTVMFDFPPDVPPGSLETQPTLTVRMRYPSGFTYEYDYGPAASDSEAHLEIWGLRDALYGRFRLHPFRTFSLRISDHEGGMALPGSRVELRSHVYPFRINATADEGGVARIWRLPDYYTYQLTVNYTVPWLGSEERVLVTSAEPYKLASTGELRTELYTLRISPRDRQGRTLDGAQVRVEPLERPGRALENATRDGYAAFHLVPTGNYTVSVGWKGMTVFKGHRYVGYHPTYGFLPTSFDVAASVDDLVVAAVDMAGNPVGAVFSVEGPTPEASRQGIEAAGGVLRLEQMPIADYRVRAANSSSVFGATVEGATTARPGERAEIRLPIFGVSLRAVSMDGKPLRGASVRLQEARATADSSGWAAFSGVPAGSYGVEVSYGGVTVYSGRLEVRDSVRGELGCAVYDVSARFESADGKPVMVRWRLIGAGMELSGVGESLAAEMLPEQEYRLTVMIIRGGGEARLLEQAVRPSELRGAVIRLPMGRLALRIVWDDGSPFEGQVAVAGETETVVSGRAELEDIPFGAYNVTVMGSGGVEVLRTRITHSGAEETIRISSASIVVRVYDALGRPVEGASITIQSQRIPGATLATAATGPDGSARLAKIPATLAPFRVTATYGGRSEERLSGPGEAAITFPAIAVGGALIDAWILLAAVGLTAAVIAVLILTGALSGRKKA
jgi:hypothetical protein